MDNTREKLIELLYEAEEQADKRCDGYENCDKCPAENKDVPCEEWLKADCLLRLGVTVQKWIPVSDPPKEDGKYLVHKDLYGTSYISTICFAKNGEKVCAYDLKGQKNVWYDYDSETGYFPLKTVTHWMPLPEPPGE